jgi:hypothetical protein
MFGSVRVALARVFPFTGERCERLADVMVARLDLVR